MDNEKYERYKAKLMATALTVDKRTNNPPPPFKWWEEKKAYFKEEHPDYDENRINRAIGFIWYHRYTEEKRKNVILAEALKV